MSKLDLLFEEFLRKCDGEFCEAEERAFVKFAIHAIRYKRIHLSKEQRERLTGLFDEEYCDHYDSALRWILRTHEYLNGVTVGTYL